MRGGLRLAIEKMQEGDRKGSLDIQIETMEAEHRIRRERERPGRLCIVCGAGPLEEGYNMGDEKEPHYRCNAHPIEGWPEQFTEDGENYWTTWEDED